MKKILTVIFTTCCLQFNFGQTEKYFELTDSVFEKDMICVKEIQFYFDMSSYFPEYQPMIDSLATMLRYYSYLKVEIGIHTDSRGSTEYNGALSQRRAELVRDSLIARGVFKERLIAKGYGETKPRYLDRNYKGGDSDSIFPKGTKLTEDYINGLNNGTGFGKKKFEDAHTLNRRMEIKILSTDYASSSNTKVYYNITHVPIADSLEMVKMDKFTITKFKWPLTKGKNPYTALYYALLKHKVTNQMYIFYETETELIASHGFYTINKND